MRGDVLSSRHHFGGLRSLGAANSSVQTAPKHSKAIYAIHAVSSRRQRRNRKILQADPIDALPLSHSLLSWGSLALARRKTLAVVHFARSLMREFVSFSAKATIVIVVPIP